MLSNENAAELLFHYETRQRERERAVLASIQDRRAAASALAVNAAAPVTMVVATPVAPKAAQRAGNPAWARPIGVKTQATAACAAA